MDIARRSVTSAAWNLLANPVRMVIVFGRSLVLARLLPVDTFGTYALASTIVSLAAVLPNWGMGAALLHRAPETADEERAASVHLTLKLMLTLAWAAILMVGAAAFAAGERRTALLVVTAARGGILLCETPQLILQRRIVHRRLVLVRLVDAVGTTAVALLLAFRGATLWALLATDVTTLIVMIIALYVWRPVWRPRLVWSAPTMRYFLGFGGRAIGTNFALQALERIDQLWTGAYLGETALGFYSRAHSLSCYPRELLATPLRSVISGTFAELKGDRRRLSQAFFRVNAALARGGFFFAGVLVLVAPEFIQLAFGPRWLPMLDALRLLAVFASLAPLASAVGRLFSAVGRPEQLLPARLAQLGVLGLGLVALGPPLGIAGVALAVDGMMVVGLVILLRRARVHADFSLVRMFAGPAVALLAGLAVGWGASQLPSVGGSAWTSGLAKLLGFTLTYGGLLLAVESAQLHSAVTFLTSQIRSRP